MSDDRYSQVKLYEAMHPEHLDLCVRTLEECVRRDQSYLAAARKAQKRQKKGMKRDNQPKDANQAGRGSGEPGGS